MNQQLAAKITRVLSIVIAIVLVLLPFYGFMTVWGASLIGHYTLVRLWKEYVIAAVGLVGLLLLIWDRPIRKGLIKQQLFWIIAGYVLLELVVGFSAYSHHAVSGKALAYGMLEDLRYVLFFVLVAAIVARDDWLLRHWKPLLLIPAALVVLFGLLEVTVLPHNFLAHFGYSKHTIPAYETVNSNSHFIRAQSTLRGANPLGAYLVMILAVLSALLVKSRVRRDQLLLGVGWVVTLVVLFLTYSRGAWIGAVLSVAIVATLGIRNRRFWRWAAVVAVILVVAAGLTFFALRHNSHFQDIVFHTSPHTVATTSDQKHLQALRQGLHSLADAPLGHGPGTAGPASVYNHYHAPRIAEDYFIQIGQDTGWLGLALFLMINAIVGILLWRQRTSALALALFASLIGLSFVGLVSYVWSDDTLSYLWWGVAAIALGAPLFEAQLKERNGHR